MLTQQIGHCSYAEMYAKTVKPKSKPKTPDTFVDFAVERLSLLGKISIRPLFGGTTLYCDGIVFALIAEKTLFLKADDSNRANFTSRNLSAFQPFEDKDSIMQYYQAPPELFEDDEAIIRWAGRAVDAGRRARMKNRKRAKRI